MPVVMEVKDTIIDAKKKYDKEKYIEVLEEQINVLEKENERLTTRISKLESNEFVINSDHLELFNLYRSQKKDFTLEDLELYSKKSVDLEIALTELLNNGYFEKPNVYALGCKMHLSIPDDKKTKLLIALKNNQEYEKEKI
jgi:hypothetical protein